MKTYEQGGLGVREIKPNHVVAECDCCEWHDWDHDVDMIRCPKCNKPCTCKCHESHDRLRNQ